MPKTRSVDTEATVFGRLYHRGRRRGFARGFGLGRRFGRGRGCGLSRCFGYGRGRGRGFGHSHGCGLRSRSCRTVDAVTVMAVKGVTVV